MKLLNCKVVAADVPPASYHSQEAERGTPGYAMSPSSIKAFMECPQRWRDGYEPPESESKDWGNAIDTLVLSSSEFTKRYCVLPETYPAPATHEKVKSGVIKAGHPLKWTANAAICKEWIKENAEGREELSTSKYVSLCKAYDRLMKDEKIRSFLDCSRRQVLVVGEVHHDGLVVPVRCLLDLEPDALGAYSASLGDFKSTRNASPRSFRRFAHQMGYHIQAAFDLDLYNAATGEMRDTWCLIIQENYKPFQTARRFFDQEFLSIGRKTYTDALGLYFRCLKTGVWPDYDHGQEQYGGWTAISPEGYMTDPAFYIAEDKPFATVPQNETTDFIP